MRKSEFWVLRAPRSYLFPFSRTGHMNHESFTVRIEFNFCFARMRFGILVHLFVSLSLHFVQDALRLSSYSNHETSKTHENKVDVKIAFVRAHSFSCSHRDREWTKKCSRVCVSCEKVGAKNWFRLHLSHIRMTRFIRDFSLGLSATHERKHKENIALRKIERILCSCPSSTRLA